jgi:acyl-coenzyme A thioesterase PaaI-like protein
MTVNYTAPAVKTDLFARARVRRAGKRIASIAVEIRDQQGALIADALVSYKIV